MNKKLKWSFFGSSLVSAYWNGAATYYRGIIRALAKRGHQITFFEPDAYDRQKNRDIPDPEWARVRVYSPDSEGLNYSLEEAADADIIVKASGIGVLDSELETAVLSLKRKNNLVVFWDVDAPATLDRMENHLEDPFRKLVPNYDLIFTYGGGLPVVKKYKEFKAKECIPVYNALDLSTHYRVNPSDQYAGTLGFLGNRLPDREKRVEDFFLSTVEAMPEEIFTMGGSGWSDKPLPMNLRYLGHVFTHEHNVFNSSTKAVLNLSRNSMAAYGFSPATRIFEAAGAVACLITDDWEGIELFLEPNKEILVAKDGNEVVEHLRALSDSQARKIGEAAYKRIVARHTYDHRAIQIEAILEGIQ